MWLAHPSHVAKLSKAQIERRGVVATTRDGHVDNKKGPAIFYRLGELKPGEQVKVSRKDGSVATFAIDKVARYAKAEFPTSLVYGTTKRAEIRLVTCGGAFDQTTGHYVDNIVVFGHLLA